MIDPYAPNQALSTLERQISMLSELRNAGTRAQEFREWRQATLTLVERIWPDQPTRATRFRRIPFSPASAKADDRVARDAFERGCAEARRLLRLWLNEVTTRGVTQDAEAPRLAEAARATLVEQRPKPKPAARPAAKSARKRKPALSEMLGFNSETLEAPPSPEPPVESTPPPAPRLREGAVAVEPLGAGTGSARPKTPEPLDAFDALAASIDQAVERAKHEVRPAPRKTAPKKAAPAVPNPTQKPAPEPATVEASAVEAPVVEAPIVEDRHMVSYVARAFISMAADLEELGVPEGHRTRVRLALVDLAKHLDCGSVTWGIIRDAVTLVMHYPGLGRQAMPLLLPYLESAA